MMTILMDNIQNHSHLPSRERVERLFKKNVELEKKRKKAAHARIPSDPYTWQHMRENYEAIILEDLAFSEKHGIELALWQLHYSKIEELRAHLSASRASAGLSSSQNGKGPARAGPDRNTKIRSQFKTFLSEATGFYHDLMVKLRAKHALPLDSFSSDYGDLTSKDGNISADVKKTLISCHRCLIYLGDLARYKGSFGEPESKAREYAAASSYYNQASSLWPSSGNPHHQLAILALYLGDELLAIYRYFRSLSVDNPFTTARDNLTIAFERNRQSYLQLHGDTITSVKMAAVKMNGKGRGRGERRIPKDISTEATLAKEKTCTISETLKFFKIRFIRLNGIFFTRTSLETFEEVLAAARKDMLQLLASGHKEEYNFGPDAAECTLVIIRMVAVLIFTVHNVKRESENQSYAEILQRPLLLQNAFTVIFDFMGNIVERCVQLSDPSTSYMLPGILVFVEWLACQQDIAVGSKAEEKQNRARSFFWNHYLSFSNKLLSNSVFSLNGDEDETCFFNMSTYDESETTNRLALFEDFELRGFLPLVPAQQVLDFSRKHTLGSEGIKEKQARVHRIIAAGKALADVVQVGLNKIHFDSKAKMFTIDIGPQISDDHLLASSIEMPSWNNAGEVEFQGSQGSSKASELKPQLFIEEEEEEIVFKPTMFDKHPNGGDSKTSSSEVLSNVVNITEVGLGNHIGPAPAPYNGLLLQNGYNASPALPSSFANINTHYVPPVQPTASVQPTTTNWLVEKEVPLVKELTKLSLFDSGLALTHGLKDGYGAMQPTDLSVPFSYQSVSAGSGNRYSVQIPEISAPSKVYSIISSGVMDSLPVKTSTIAPPGMKKNPISRPVRHSGPPPGFSSVPAKQVDVSLPNLASEIHHPMVDDYSWLDGYKPLSSTHGIGFNNYLNQPSSLYDSMNKSNNGSAEMASFPFPGKQNNWQDSQISEQMKIYKEQQQPVHQFGNGSQQSSAMLKQYHGQSLWEGRFFV